VKTVITVGVGDGSGNCCRARRSTRGWPGRWPFAEALAEGARCHSTPVALTGDDLLFLQYTGGTTGLSKGAALSHRNLVANTEQFKAFMPVAR
jgi:long-chain acyl-CoA synthetase